MDIVGGVLLADGIEAKVVTGLDDHSRYCVIATVVRRATGRAVCAAFAAALARFGLPGEVLTDNGKQFTGRFTKPRPGEVLFERICRENGIVARNTKPRSPTTTGKVERFHQSLQGECLNGRIFDSVEQAQAAVDLFVAEYNYDRPHQGIDDAFPADRFHRPTPGRDRFAAEALPLRLPAGLPPTAPPAPRKPPVVAVDTSLPVSTGRPQPVQLVRVVPPSGNLTVAQQQVWLGPALAGTPVTIWVDTDRLHVLTADGARIKSSPSRLSQRDLARLVADGGSPAGPPPLPQPEPQTTAVEVHRVVNACGGISIAGRQISVGMPLAGQRIRIRLDGILLHVIDDAGQLRRTLRCPLPPTAPGRIRDARPASPVPPPATAPTVERIVSNNGSIQVAGQRIQNRQGPRPQTRHRRPRRTHHHRLRHRDPDRGRSPPQHHRTEPHQSQTPDHHPGSASPSGVTWQLVVGYGADLSPSALCSVTPAGRSVRPDSCDVSATSSPRRSRAGSPSTIVLSTSSTITRSYRSELRR